MSIDLGLHVFYFIAWYTADGKSAVKILMFPSAVVDKRFVDKIGNKTAILRRYDMSTKILYCRHNNILKKKGQGIIIFLLKFDSNFRRCVNISNEILYTPMEETATQKIFCIAVILKMHSKLRYDTRKIVPWRIHLKRENIVKISLQKAWLFAKSVLSSECSGMLDAQPATVYLASPDDPSCNSKYGFWSEHHFIYFLTIVLSTIVIVGMKFDPTCRQRNLSSTMALMFSLFTVTSDFFIFWQC